MAVARSAAPATGRIPLPPPPAEALTRTGKPISAAAAAGSAPSRSSWPGTIGTPAASISARARTFEPIASIACGGGPIQTRPASPTRVANSAFSARNP